MIRVVSQRADSTGDGIRIEALGAELGPEVEARLRAQLLDCPDLAFAHLTQVTVAGQPGGSQPSLFVWLLPEGVASLRSALNLVSEAVARALPDDTYLDVLILNSAPELLEAVAGTGAPFVVRDDAERRRAVEAAGVAAAGTEAEVRPRFRWW
jgi:hypothetical protein